MTDTASGEPLTPDYLKRALRAFKKRLKLMRLDHESGIAGGPCSSGRSSGIVAIRPPSQFPKEVWDKLVEMGKLTTEGNGLFELGGGHGPQRQR